MVNSKNENVEARKRPPAKTPEGRQNQLIALAYDEAEKQILAGRASSQVIVHFLKMGTEETRLARLKTEQEIKLADAKIQQIESAARVEDLYREAIDAFRGYQIPTDTEID